MVQTVKIFFLETCTALHESTRLYHCVCCHTIEEPGASNEEIETDANSTEVTALTEQILKFIKKWGNFSLVKESIESLKLMGNKGIDM